MDGVSFDVYKGETFGIVGESGCGKSTTGRGIVGLLEPTAGTILFEGKDIKGCSRREMARHIQIIFQDPYSSLDPRMTVGRCIEEPLDVHKVGIKSERWSKVLELMQEVGLREDQGFLTNFPVVNGNVSVLPALLPCSRIWSSAMNLYRLWTYRFRHKS